MPATDWETNLEAGTYSVTIVTTEAFVDGTLYRFSGWQDVSAGIVDPNLTHTFTHPTDLSTNESLLIALYVVVPVINAQLTVIGVEDSVSLTGIDFTIQKL